MVMLNAGFLLLITTLMIALTSCGFHVPQQNTALNAIISAENNNAFANALAKRFNKKASQSFIIEVGNEDQKVHTASYDSNGQKSSYTLSVNVPIKVFNHNKQLLLSEQLTASTHLNAAATQAERLQTEQASAQLRNAMIKRLLRRLHRLNEN